MAAPTNISFLTAEDLGTALPATVTPRVDDAGTTYTVYYSYTAKASDPPVLGAWAFGDLTVYKPTIELYTGPASAPVSLFNGLPNKPIQFLVTAGVTYLFKIATNVGNPTPANLSFNLQRFNNATYPTGSIGVNDDTTGHPLAVLSSTTGLPLFFTSQNSTGESAAITTSGILALTTQNGTPNDRLVIYNSALQIIATVTPFPGIHIRDVTSDMSTRFYVNGFGIGTVKAYDTSGTFLASWTFPDLDNITQSVTHGNTIMYSASNGAAAAIRRFDLVNNVAMTDLVAGIAGYHMTNNCLMVLADGTIVACYVNTATNDCTVKAYSAAGAVLHTYSMGASNDDVRLCMAIDDPASFWVWTKDVSGGVSTGFSTFRNIRVSDGATLTSLNSVEYEAGVYNAAAISNPTMFGHSESCGFWITRAGPATPTTTTTTQLMRRQRTAPHLSQEQGWIFYQRVQFDFQAGVGQVSGTYVDPTVMIQWSDDGGHTWSQEVLAHVGRIGQYKARAIIRRPHGRSRDRIYRVTVSDPVAWNLIGAYLEAEPGTRPF